MSSFLEKFKYNSLFLLGIFSIFVADTSSSLCMFIFNYEPEMPESMLED